MQWATTKMTFMTNKKTTFENEKQPMFFPCQPDELLEKIQALIRHELQFLAPIRRNKEVGYDVPGFVKKPVYKSDEICTLFQISRQTLHTWVKENKLKVYKIKSRAYYLWSDIEKLISPKE
jgi:hypothetical protein